NAANLASGTVADARLSSNVPLKNAANTFTADQTINTNVKIAGNLAVGGAALGTSNVARTDAANTFTQNQEFTKIEPTLFWRDTSQPVNQRLFRMWQTNQVLMVQALSDDQSTALATPLYLTRTADAVIGKDLYEKSRTAAMGHWIDVPFNAANFQGLGGNTWTVTAGNITANFYTLIGKTLIWTLWISSSTIGGSATPNLSATIPGTMSNIANSGVMTVTANDSGGPVPSALVAVWPGDLSKVVISRNSGTWAGTLTISF